LTDKGGKASSRKSKAARSAAKTARGILHELRSAERFYTTVVAVTALISIVSFAGLVGGAILRTQASSTLIALLDSHDKTQQLNLRLNVLDIKDAAAFQRLNFNNMQLKSSLENLTTKIDSVGNLHPEILIADSRIRYWSSILQEKPTELSIARAKVAIQDASEVLSDELSVVTVDQTNLLNFLQVLIEVALIVAFVSILIAAYMLLLLFLAIRSVLRWDLELVAKLKSSALDPELPEIRVPFQRVFPGAALLSDQSLKIVAEMGKRLGVQRKLANKNLTLSDQLQKTVNELVSSREEFARSAQLAAVGKVAGSVSHEINNPVTGVLGYLAFIKKRSTDESLTVWIDKAIREVDRIGRIARSLLVFSRHSATQAPAPFTIGPALENVATLVEPQMHEAEVTLTVNPSADLPQVIGRADELQQCLLNVLLNARYALLKQPERKINISTAQVGKMVEVSISDSGTGVPDAVQEHLFQPFYTTKPAGEGSGLGLAVAHELMHGMGGSIRYDKSHKPGAKFILALPVFDGAIVAVNAEVKPEVEREAPKA
jgi:C4-dicarboxylate-specific signal transduction histidine kinase